MIEHVDQREYSTYLQSRSVFGALYRRFYLYPTLSRYLTGRVLDVGCGIGDFLAFQRGAIGIDVNLFNVEYCQARGLPAYISDPDKFPFSKNSFDSVLLDNVLEHIVDPTSTLSEIRRVTCRHGLLVVGVPGEKGFASDDDHKNFYGEKKLVQRLCDAGFEKQRFRYMPFKSKWLALNMRQYCIYGIFKVTC